MQLNDGSIFVVAGWNDSGIKCVTLDYEMDLEKTGYLENKVAYNGQSAYLAYNNSPFFTWTGQDGHAEPNQYYEFQEASLGVYVLVSTNNGKAVAAVSTGKGSQVHTEKKDGADKRQQWVFEKAEDGYFRVKNVASNLYLTTPRISESEAMDNRFLTLEEKTESAAQLWRTDAGVTYEEDAANQTAANEVTALIHEIGEVAYTADSKSKIDAAREAYNQLTEAQKALVTNVSVLTEAEANYARLEEEQKPGAGDHTKPGDDTKPEDGTKPGNGAGAQPPSGTDQQTRVPTAESLMAGNPGLPKGSSEESLKSSFQALTARVTKSTKTSNKIKWKKIGGADGYVVFGNRCNGKGKSYQLKALTVLGKNSATSYTHKKLAKGTYYKYVVQAYKMVNGKPQILATSKTIHAATAGGKYGNVRALKLNKKKVTLKAGKRFTVKAKEVKSGKQYKQHSRTAYESSNPKVATVTKKGVVKAKRKGSCTVYVYAQNGVYSKVKVTVKK